ncbi:hypothetical protein [Cohnella hashimotonis]|uniref:Protein-export membrane protein SecG n=1 Tax=Cohnella hashimotonis TaxID=2826895 RepID=A0ABT6TGP5_9BACL|nr:hypothetical protein [Cohnella hashimotonis]MDI4645986.1 hypothetical protein [Cohnella hashimotonis]
MIIPIILVIVVMVVGFAATIAIGQSRTNKEGNPGYFQQTGKKWANLSWIYVVCTVAIVAVLIYALNR